MDARTLKLVDDAAGAMAQSRPAAIASWIMQLIVASILFQTLFFKFTAAEESVFIFRTLGLEPWGRMGTGVVELAACILILTPRTVTLGALLSAAVIAGAIASHLTKLGIVVRNDGGLLFALAWLVFVLSIAILVVRRTQAPWAWLKLDRQKQDVGGIA